jgi:quercetin dioxygenase-like cupin family protein
MQVMQPEKKNPATMPAAEAVRLADLVAYGEGAIVSRALTQGPAGSLTVFAFDKGQKLSEHTAPFDAFVSVLEGETLLSIGGKPIPARAGETVLMPANIPHAVAATERFKMLLVMLRQPPAAEPK